MAHEGVGGDGIFSKFFGAYNEDRIEGTNWGHNTKYDLVETESRKNSYLEDVSNLMFVFPNSEDIGGTPTKLFLPFFEDPTIRERKRARYVTLSPIGRPSNLFAYTGADAREFTLDFNMTLPNIIKFCTLTQKDIFLTNTGVGAVAAKNTFKQTQRVVVGPTASKYERDFYDGPDSNKQNLANKNAISEVAAQKLLNVREKTHHQNVLKAMDIIRYWTDVIRSSCYNNVSNPTLGPPIVRLTHGILFRDLPCIVDSYNISYDRETAGYHKETMLPRKIMITMTLKELRSGNYGDFNIAEGVPSIEGDNLAGWEVIVDQFGGTLDPVSLRQSPTPPPVPAANP